MRIAMATVPVGPDRFETIDEGKGDPVLLLHGFPTSRLLWQRVVPKLSQRFRVLAPDLKGYGESSGEGPVDLASQAEAMLRLLDALDLPRAVVVAHDVGSAAGQILAVRAPDRVRALVVVDGVHGGEWAMGSVETIRCWDPAKAASLAKVLARTMRVKDPALREILGGYEGEDGGRRLIRAAQAFDPRQTESIGEALGNLPMPRLVVWGDHDEYLPLHEVGEPLAKTLKARLVVLPGGHFLPLDAPDALANALLTFLDAI
ncbi:MAG: alpha/beta fold hydrolase [Myxococcales bacterium]